MTVRNFPMPVFRLPMETPQDIEYAANSNVKVREEIAEVMKRYYPPGVEFRWNFRQVQVPAANDRLVYPSGALDGVAQVTENLEEMGHLFKVAYCDMKGITDCSRVMRLAASYQSQLNRSLAVCTGLTPLFLRALKCHQTALNCVNDSKESAMQAMAQTGEIAREIAPRFAQLGEEYEPLVSMGGGVMTALAHDAYPIHARNRRLNKTQEWTDPLEVSLLKAKSYAADLALETLLKINSVIDDVGRHWNGAQRHIRLGLDEPILANPDLPDLLEVLDVEDEFKRSYLSWLTLAKVNQTMITALQNAISAMEDTRRDMARMEELYPFHLNRTQRGPI